MKVVVAGLETTSASDVVGAVLYVTPPQSVYDEIRKALDEGKEVILTTDERMLKASELIEKMA